MKTQELLIEEALAPTVFTYVQKAADALSLETYVIGGYVRDTFLDRPRGHDIDTVSYTRLRAHQTRGNLVCRRLREKKSTRDPCYSSFYKYLI